MRNRERWKVEGYRVRKEREKRERKCGARERWVERGLDGRMTVDCARGGSFLRSNW